MKLASLLVSVAAAAASLAAASEAGEPKLDIKVTHEVECTRKTAEMDTIHVHYRGRLAANDKEFDASYNRGQPFKFTLGTNQVIKGWDKGLLDMCIGEKRTLTVPPEFGYGNRAVGGNLIPAGSTLIFETELIGIHGYDPSKEEKKPPAEDGKDTEAKDDESPSSPSPSPSPTPESDAADSIKAKVGEQVAGAVNAAAGVIKTILIETDDDQDHVEL